MKEAFQAEMKGTNDELKAIKKEKENTGKGNYIDKCESQQYFNFDMVYNFSLCLM